MVIMHNTAFWLVTPFGPVGTYRRFGRIL